MPPSSSWSQLAIILSSFASLSGMFQRSRARAISFLLRRPERSVSMYWNALYMSEKRVFRPVLAIAIISLSSFSAWNFSSLVMPLFFGEREVYCCFASSGW